MNAESAPNIALYYDADAYTESHARAGATGGPAGLMGRQVAGKEFLDAYLTFGQWDQLTGVVRSRDRADSLIEICHEHPSSRSRPRRLSIQLESEFMVNGTVTHLHFPCPADSRFAWARQSANSRYALSGVTHTLSSLAAIQSLRELVLAPFEEYDSLICTSRAVAEMVRAVTSAFADYLRDRFGGSPRLRCRLEVIPLGVNPDRFHPPTPNERMTERARLGIQDDETVILCVGRLSHHAKAHPFPMFHAVEQAARCTGKKLHIIFAGWAAHPAIDRAFREGAERFAPSVRVSFVDGLDRSIRSNIWHAADLFMSLPDNIQETFGLVVVEAMASGLPVIGSDWDGYRDLVLDGMTGYLVPTRMIAGATANATVRLTTGQSTYDQFLAECSQTASVDLELAAAAVTRLVTDDSLRKQMGVAGRQRVESHFTWEKIILAYEDHWLDQGRVLQAHTTPSPRRAGPALYPNPEHSFAAYPTSWLTDDSLVQASTVDRGLLKSLLEMPLTNLVANRRCSDRDSLESLLAAAEHPRTVGALAGDLERTGTDPVAARATIAWLIKYGLLRMHNSQGT